MSGKHINSIQVQLYLNARLHGCTQQTASAKGGFSVSTAHRIDHQKHQPSKGKPRDWRTRKDPFSQVWESELIPLLERNPDLQPTTLLEYLQEKYPNQYSKSQLRTLQRRVQQWRAIAGPPKEVMFLQQHEPGRMGLSDFTHLTQVTS